MAPPLRSAAARRAATFSFGLALALSACGGESPREQHAALERGRVPIVVFLADTLRADRLGCYGYDRPTSPRLDAFAAEGVRFENCLAQSTWTKPTTASLLTGLYPSRHGATTDTAALGDELVTLAEVLSAEGYRCAAFGFNPHIFGGTGFEQGFDTFVGIEPPALPRAYPRAEEIVDRALAWLDEVPAGEPYFLYVHVFDPHAPYDPPEPYRSRFDRGFRGERDTYYMMQRRVHATDLSVDEWEHYRDSYDAEIAYTDAQFGRLLDAVDLDETAVVFVSDHGEELFDHGGWSHTPTMYQELLHVPLIASFPPLRATHRGVAREDLVLQVDLFPTVHDLLGLAPPEDLPGSSLLAKALGALPPTPFGISEAEEFHTFKKAVVANRLKYVRTWSPEEGEVLFDLDEDPGETRDVLSARVDDWADLKRTLDEHVEGAPARYALRFENRGDALVTLFGYVVTDVDHVQGSQLSGCELHHEGAEDWDGPFLFEEHELDGRMRKAVQFTLRTAPGDADGFVFAPAADEERIELLLRVDVDPVDLAHVHLGASGEAPLTDPIALDLTDPERYASAGPGGGDDPDAPYAVWVWRSLDAVASDAELSPEQVEALSKIGYMGDR
ncbi:MAG: sulfatase [Planctomycetota bacterium]